ncbi:protein KINESIN LIGHT CHAIN-RELATED 2-like [Rhododendron vialii]|uniref:protein KINESIN LIGHT CHAIN-RELATED 2-like n=1 Tax=Rhododendron vialii TaxID=182163 RepID=UPI00265EF155|nr:protein KINESIN LIGHT CHAIN-RELATED 2-like [Rhododendron vialii]
MPELVMEGLNVDEVSSPPNQHYIPYKKSFTNRSPKSPLSTHSPGNESIDQSIDGEVDISIEQLYRNVFEMQSSDPSPSRPSFLSYGDESRIDSELRFYAGGSYREVEIRKEVVVVENKEPKKQTGLLNEKSEAIAHLSPRSKSFHGKPPTGKRNGKARKANETTSNVGRGKMEEGKEDSLEAAYLGPCLLKQAQDLVPSGGNPRKALELALRALKSFESCASEKPNLELVMCLHVVASLYCRLGQYSEAIPILDRSIEISDIDEGPDSALAKFSGLMKLGDTYALIGKIENSILCYTGGLEVQREFLGEKDYRVGETCRYVAEAHVQAFQFDEAEKLCQLALDIHKENGSPPSPQEAADGRLMGLILESKGEYEAALGQYVLASMTMAENGQELDLASIDCSIGDTYLSLSRYDEAILAYQKALVVFKSVKGENQLSVASVFVRLADLYNKIGKFKESKSNCENALRIYSKPVPGGHTEEIASGLINVSAIYESMNEPGEALKLLQKALKIYGNAPGMQCTIAGIEAQVGVMYYMMGSYSDSHDSLESAISKLREVGEKKSSLFGVALNQMGLVCVQLHAINEAAELFQEARSIFESEYGPYHPNTLGVYSNLAGTYDALGRTDDAIEILDYVVGMREEKLGTANPDVDDEKRRLAELLKEGGRVRNRKLMSLETLLDTNLQFL